MALAFSFDVILLLHLCSLFLSVAPPSPSPTSAPLPSPQIPHLSPLWHLCVLSPRSDADDRSPKQMKKSPAGPSPQLPCLAGLCPPYAWRPPPMPVKSELPEGSSFHIGAPSESDTILSEKCLQNMYVWTDGTM